MSFKTELHCHMNFSACSEVSAADMVEKYVTAGYNTVVITNHFNRHHQSREGSYDALVSGAFAAIDEVRAAADGRLNIIAGMEITFSCMPNDFLLYGVDQRFFRDMGEDMFDLRPRQLKDKVHEYGGIIIQAHPFRFGQTVVNPAEVDGIEVFNGHVNQYSHNEVAKMWAIYWAEKYSRDERFILTSGTDHHHTHHVPTGGIITDEEIVTSEMLIDVLKSGEYSRITSDLGTVNF